MAIADSVKALDAYTLGRLVDEIVQWRNTGILSGKKLEAFAKLHSETEQDIRIAESVILLEAAHRYAKSMPKLEQIDFLGSALELESCSGAVLSRTAQRAVIRGANMLRLVLGAIT